MTRDFQVGEKIGFLHEEGRGTIIRIISKQEVIIHDDYGFDRNCNIDELIKIQSENYNLKSTNFSNLNKNRLQKKITSSKSNKNQEIPQIDLHIENLLDTHRNMSNSEILEVQMRAFKGFFYANVRKGATRLIIIHGVGEGVLKNEIREFLRGYPSGVDFWDAPYTKFGGGATEVRVYPTALREESMNRY